MYNNENDNKIDRIVYIPKRNNNNKQCQTRKIFFFASKYDRQQTDTETTRHEACLPNCWLNDFPAQPIAAKSSYRQPKNKNDNETA